MRDSLDPNLIRLQCDGELSPEQARQLQDYLEAHPEAAAEVQKAVGFEQQLRERVGIVMRSSCPCCPTALAARIRETVAQTSMGDTTAADRDAGDAPATVAGRLFASPFRANFAAIAATLALVAGVVLYGIFGRTIDEIPPRTTIDLVADASVFADQEHSRCAYNQERLQQTALLRDPKLAEEELTNWLNTPVAVFDLSEAGYEFFGALHADMPVPGRSAHLLYRKIGDSKSMQPMVSVFVVPGTGGCKKLCCGEKWVQCDVGGKCSRRVLRASDGRLVYFLVCCNERDMEGVMGRIGHFLASSSKP